MLYEKTCKSFLKQRSDDQSQDDLYRISWKIRDHTDKNAVHEGEMHLKAKPHCAEKIHCRGTENESKGLEGKTKTSFGPAHKETGDQNKEEKSSQISAGRTCQFSESA